MSPSVSAPMSAAIEGLGFRVSIGLLRSAALPVAPTVTMPLVWPALSRNSIVR